MRSDPGNLQNLFAKWKKCSTSDNADIFSHLFHHLHVRKDFLTYLPTHEVGRKQMSNFFFRKKKYLCRSQNVASFPLDADR